MLYIYTSDTFPKKEMCQVFSWWIDRRERKFEFGRDIICTAYHRAQIQRETCKIKKKKIAVFGEKLVLPGFY